MEFLVIFYENKESSPCCLLLKVHTGNSKTKIRSLFRKKYKSNLFPVALQNSWFDMYGNDLLSLKKIKPKKKRIQNKLFKAL